MWKNIMISLAVAMLIAGNIVAQNIVDAHCHNILPSYMAVLEKHHATMDEGFPLPEWNVDSHLKFMEDAGIGYSILTMPAPQPYFGDTKECWQTIRQYNEHCAQLNTEYPDKFKFCASLPLPDVDAAIAEAIYALDTLKADGVKLATNSSGQYLGDEKLDPLMRVLDERNAVIFIHPHKPVPMNGGLMATLPLAAYEYPAETTRAILNMLARNVLARYPHIKVVVPHCGSFLPLAIPRLKAVLPVLQAKGLVGEVNVDENLSCLYYDLAGAASASAIRNMLTITSPEHILYGSDYPYQPANVLKEKLTQLEKDLSDDKSLAPFKEMFLWENACRLFHIPLPEEPSK